MERIYNSKQIHNQLKKKQYEEYIESQKKYYEEYIKRKKKYYIYIKKYYKEYVGNKNKYYLDKKRCYEKYVEDKRKYYIYKKRYDEEHYKKNNNILENKKNKILQSELSDSFKIDIIEKNSVKDDNIQDNSSINIKDLYNGEFVEKAYEEFLKDSVKDKENKEDVLIEEDKFKNSISIKESYNEEFLEKIYEESVKDNIKEKKDRWIEEDKSKDNIGIKESYNEEFSEKNYEKSLKDNIEEKEEVLIEEDKLKDRNSIKDLVEESEVSTVSLYGKFPVILAEVDLTIPVEGTISLDEEIIEIKRTRKNIFLTKSHIIPFPLKDKEPNSAILFIEGFIKNNIEYESQSKTTVEKNNFYANIKHCTVEVPFNFTTKIIFLRLPVFIEKTTTRELEVFTDNSQSSDTYKESVIECEPYEESYVFTEVFNEKPFIELVKATFIKIDIDKKLTCESYSTQKFTKITEKIILNLTLKVLQKQQVKVIIE